MIKKVGIGDTIIERKAGKNDRRWSVIHFKVNPSPRAILESKGKIKEVRTITLFTSPCWFHANPERNK